MLPYKGWWEWRNDVYDFDKFTDNKKQDIIEVILYRTLGEPSSRHHSYVWAVSNIINHVDNVTGLKLLKSCINDKNDEPMLDVVSILAVRGVDDNTLKSTLFSSAGVSAQKALLCLPNLAVKEEELALRAISTSTYTPRSIYDKKYCPSLDALKKLPPIMRLKSLESLLNVSNLSYNIFEKITNEEEFKSLLFSASTKHLDRVNSVWEKYQDIVKKGTIGILTIKYLCKKCGVIEVKITSGVLHSKSSLENSYLKNLTHDWCPVCGDYNSKPQISGELLK